MPSAVLSNSSVGTSREAYLTMHAKLSCAVTIQWKEQVKEERRYASEISSEVQIR